MEDLVQSSSREGRRTTL